jgi:hypothetical protein
MPFNFARSQQSAHRLIVRWGKPGFIIRDGVARPAMIARPEYTPRERGLFLDGATRLVVSAFNLAVPPDHEQDQLKYLNQLYRIVSPVTGPNPAGIQIYYDCSCMLIGPA